MARSATLSDELKNAIKALPSKEKDKLLFRLVKLKPELVAQLEFILLEGGETTDMRRDAVRATLVRGLEHYRYISAGLFFMELRDLSGEINRHVKTTKDKYGEVELNFVLLKTAIHLYGQKWKKESVNRQYKLNEYFAKKTLRTLQLMCKLDEDYHMDFRRDRNEIGAFYAENEPLALMAREIGLDLNWLYSTDATPRICKL